MDSHRPWNLANVFGGFPVDPAAGEEQSRFPAGAAGGRIERAYKPGKGGLIVFDDGDIEEDLGEERDAYLTLLDMPDVEDGEAEDLGETDDENDGDGGNGDDEDDGDVLMTARAGKKRKSWSDRDEDDFSEDDDRPVQRRRSNSVISTHTPTPQQMSTELTQCSSRARYQNRRNVPGTGASSP